MAIIKCKMCGGDLAIIEGQTVAECEYCGSRQTVPAADSEKKLTLFGRANRLRSSCEFDKAAGIYETIAAEFQEEAEAYWGLVLCKYGIEYVDDPATGKKIPTCHRSSFDSVMEDPNLEQALENADVIARKVYREEAKQLEEIRKGIIEVSAKEDPYDIFICYKESAEDGQRTLDSVLAQDIYDALTAKDYRVFFARISLEDKIGQEYEPFIFAALNSAKIMLAVGTDYEYYNAVWVKNEWSRFLKLMERDKSKHLIPCFKGIDAYDMPKEFNRLQAQDLGKVGAMQDLLRGIEKLLPKQKSTTVIQERVVVGGSGDNKIASLLDRGNMALEDGDWAKADSFFEDVLNNDSKNAQAYLGKTLAQERCRTIDAFARKRKDASQNVRGQKLSLESNHAHVAEMVEKYSLPGYVEPSKIREFYTYDLSYHSDVAERKQQYKNEETYWENHKQLSRAEKFAVGTVAENLSREKKALFAALSDRVKKAESAEAAAQKDVLERYTAHLQQADEKAEKLYNDGLSRREKYYQELIQNAKTSVDVAELNETAKKFARLGDYQDSKNFAEHCRKRAEEELAKLDAAKEAKRIADAKAEAARKKKNTRNGIIAGIAAAVVITVILVITNVVIPANNYEKAEEMLAVGQYEEAVDAFAALGDYKDSAVKMQEAENALNEAIEAKIAAENADSYAQATAMMEAGDYLSALDIFTELGAYKDSATMVEVCHTEVDYTTALEHLEAGQHEEAYTLLTSLGDFRDAKEYLNRFVPLLTERTSTWYDGSGNNIQYIYDSNMRIETIEYDGVMKYAFFYYEDGTLKQMEEIFSTGIRVHTYNEKGHPVFFGHFNNETAAYEFSWMFEYGYDTEGNATSILGRYVCGDEEADYTWNMSLSQGDMIEVADLTIGSEDVADAARNRQIISILRNGGTVREQYDFRFVNLDAYKDGIAMDFIVSPRFVHKLDEAGNVIKTEIRHLSVGGSEIFGETDFELTYNENGCIVEKRYNDADSNYNDYYLGIGGMNGENVLSYAVDDNNLVTSVEWMLGGKLLRTEGFTYDYRYMPES